MKATPLERNRRLVLDQGIPRDAAGQLRAAGCDCVHVGEIGMWKATDEEILAFALANKAAIVTLMRIST
jgi:predicted nuclease of predicted toxin-antitoxin system